MITATEGNTKTTFSTLADPNPDRLADKSIDCTISQLKANRLSQFYTGSTAKKLTSAIFFGSIPSVHGLPTVDELAEARNLAMAITLFFLASACLYFICKRNSRHFEAKSPVHFV